MREKQIEQKLVKAVKQSGGIALKFISPGFDGMPDRLVLLPGGKIAFVEVKAKGQKPRPLQVRRHEMLRRLGFWVYVLDDARQIGGYWMKYNPHKYQSYATEYILNHPVSAIFLDMGLGKSIITLTAIFDLALDSFQVRKILVIAPLRVARDTWPAEIEKWDHLQGLKYSVAVGNERERKAALIQKADVYIINRENVEWLVTKSGLPFDYDMVVVDELSSFKSHQAKRFKALLKVRPSVKRIVGLTGTPSSNGLMDLWAEFRLLDMGQRLGQFIGNYRGTFFVPDKRNQQLIFSYKPKPGAEDAIYRLISDITVSMKATDHLWFKHDLTRIMKRFPAVKLDDGDSIRRWNSGEIPIAVIHPASAGHGLNLQGGSSTLVWFGLTWSLELYQQTNARLWRQGQKDAVVIHHIIAKGTIDEQVMAALQRKKKTQSALIDAVKANLEQEAVI